MPFSFSIGLPLRKSHYEDYPKSRNAYQASSKEENVSVKTRTGRKLLDTKTKTRRNH